MMRLSSADPIVSADDAVAFFQRCTAGLKSDGVIFVKENICSQEQGFIVDNVSIIHCSSMQLHPWVCCRLYCAVCTI